RLVVVAGGGPFLADPGDQEDLVVHGQAEQDGEHQHGQERFDRPGLAEVKQPQAPAVLEDRDQNAERGRGSEQVHHRRDRGDEQAAEGQRQQTEPQDEDDPDEDQQLGGDDGGEVVVGGRDAADVDAQRGATFGGGDHAVAQ